MGVVQLEGLPSEIGLALGQVVFQSCVAPATAAVKVISTLPFGSSETEGAVTAVAPGTRARRLRARGMPQEFVVKPGNPSCGAQ